MTAIFRPSANLAATVALVGVAALFVGRYWLVVGLAPHRLVTPCPLVR